MSWNFAAAKFLDSKDPFKYYSSPNYVNPGNATYDVLENFSAHFNTNESNDHHRAIYERNDSSMFDLSTKIERPELDMSQILSNDRPIGNITVRSEQGPTSILSPAQIYELPAGPVPVELFTKETDSKKDPGQR